MSGFFSSKPTVYRFRYEHENGHWREISVPVGAGRFRRGSQKRALEIAERRLHEQYGDGVFAHENRVRQTLGNDSIVTPEANLLRGNPDLHQSNYRHVSTSKT